LLLPTFLPRLLTFVYRWARSASEVYRLKSDHLRLARAQDSLDSLLEGACLGEYKAALLARGVSTPRDLMKVPRSCCAIGEGRTRYAATHKNAPMPHPRVQFKPPM